MRFTPLALAAGLCLAAPAASLAAPGKPGAKPTPKAAAKYDEKKLAALEAQLAKKPSTKLKMETAEANYQVGYAMMMNPDLPPRVKYRGALKKFKRALDLNPQHAKAAHDRKTIEDIYKSMGRPIPE
jgi:hypothetical protein